ncbi:MAG: hypothetical protein Ct9H300mP21_02810 [Pseudomonadota bacterium]|nr:MAG: hypothetical protein Ct9H300mP21_02810 [Pseudomonadota bacterium]
MACQPAVVGIGIGGCKDTTMRIAKEAACLRAVGDRNPDPQIAELEEELKELGNSIGMGPMGFVGVKWLWMPISKWPTPIPVQCRLLFTHFVLLHVVPPPVYGRTVKSNFEPTPSGSPIITAVKVYEIETRSGTDMKNDIDINKLEMREVYLTCPVKSEDLVPLKLGDQVYLSGVIFTGREGLYQRLIEQNLELRFP